MKSQKLLGLLFLIFAFTFTSSSAMFAPQCPSGIEDPETSYDGNWDLHVGDCWTPPEPHTCTVCNYM